MTSSSSHKNAEPTPERDVDAIDQVGRRDDDLVGREGVELLEKRGRDARHLSRCAFAARLTLAAEPVEFVEEEDARAGAGGLEDLGELLRGLPEVALDHAIELHDRDREPEFPRDPASRERLARTARAIEEHPGGGVDAGCKQSRRRFEFLDELVVSQRESAAEYQVLRRLRLLPDGSRWCRVEADQVRPPDRFADRGGSSGVTVEFERGSDDVGAALSVRVSATPERPDELRDRVSQL